VKTTRTWFLRPLGERDFRVIEGDPSEGGVDLAHTVDGIPAFLAEDAHLIAAAPDLYAALEIALAHIGDFRSTNHEHQSTRATIKAALAKARGES
jgi:hypothetical protein